MEFKLNVVIGVTPELSELLRALTGAPVPRLSAVQGSIDPVKSEVVAEEKPEPVKTTRTKKAADKPAPVLDNSVQSDSEDGTEEEKPAPEIKGAPTADQLKALIIKKRQDPGKDSAAIGDAVKAKLVEMDAASLPLLDAAQRLEMLTLVNTL